MKPLLVRIALVGAGALFVLGCASRHTTLHYTPTAEAVRAADRSGARRIPLGALHLRFAEEQLALAHQLATDGEYARAERVLARARADADLAAALGREAEARAAAQAAQSRSRPLDREREPSRAPAERGAKASVERLRPFAEVKEAPSEIVITISASMLFPIEGAAVLPTAKESLDDVARAVRETPQRRVTVMALAQTTSVAKARARAIRQALVERGVPAELLVDEGHGGVTDARVEIVVEGAER